MTDILLFPKDILCVKKPPAMTKLSLENSQKESKPLLLSLVVDKVLNAKDNIYALEYQLQCFWHHAYLHTCEDSRLLFALLVVRIYRLIQVPTKRNKSYST